MFLITGSSALSDRNAGFDSGLPSIFWTKIKHILYNTERVRVLQRNRAVRKWWQVYKSWRYFFSGTSHSFYQTKVHKRTKLAFHRRHRQHRWTQRIHLWAGNQARRYNDGLKNIRQPANRWRFSYRCVTVSMYPHSRTYLHITERLSNCYSLRLKAKLCSSAWQFNHGCHVDLTKL